ncbi:MAG: acyl--CoA ligase [Deltaproteobacteria bacterium]|nr:acyl--CoA ligase [Deltaproteobacteria bacterium]
MSGDKNIFDVFKTTAEKQGDRTAIIYLGTKYSYRRVKDLAERFASAMLDQGVRPGDRVIIYIPHGIQWVVVWLGIQKIGGVCIPITPIFTPYDLKYIANDSDANAIVCADTNFGYVAKVLPETSIRRIFVARISDFLPWWKRLCGRAFDVVPKGEISHGENTSLLGDLSSGGRSSESLFALCRNQEVIEILYTGGTTKSPKGVPINVDLFLAQCRLTMESLVPLFPPEKNVLMCGVPLFHILGQSVGLGLLLGGGALILHPRPTLDAICVCIERFKAKSMIGVPAVYRMILEHKRLDQYDLGSVECWMSAGDVMPVEIEKRFREKFGRPIYQAYGTTETGGGISMCPVGIESPPKSVGKVFPGKNVRVVDSVTLEVLGPGETGELLVSSPYMVTGYLNKPEETQKAFIEMDGERWYRTGDIVYIDERGFLFFVDRTADTIKHKGYRISSSEVEATLQEHPAVIGACVVGVPDQAVGERIKAFVVLKEDIKGITGYDLIKWCRERLTSYKVPQYIEFRDMLPKSKVGKLLKRELRVEGIKRLDQTS